MGERRWLGAVEGYYGPPLSHEERVELIRWLGTQGFNAYAYAPKDDPLHRERWREPYPEDRRALFRELVAEGRAAGLEVVLVVSPGLDWGDDDEAALAVKLEAFAEDGAQTLGIAFDDVPPGGAQLGAAHASGIAAAVKRLGDGFEWITCPTDYASDRVTAYLRAYHDGLPDGVEVMWTGPSIVSPRVTGEMAAALGTELGRPLLFAENYPVNDGPMAGVLHLGPYRGRAPDLPAATSGVFFNFMSFPRASRLALAAGARFWRDPTGDPEAIWRECLAASPGLEPLARASRSWIGDEGPDAGLASAAAAALDGDTAPLKAYIDAGVRDGLEPALAAEIEPWLAQWEAETLAMRYATMWLDEPDRWGVEGPFAVAEAWARARHSRLQLFGIRWAYYPLVARAGDELLALPEALVTGANLTDLLCATVIERASKG